MRQQQRIPHHQGSEGGQCDAGSRGGKTVIRGITCDANRGYQLSFKVLTSTGGDVTNTYFNITYTQVPSSKTSWSIGSPDEGDSKIQALSTAPAGSYVLEIIVTDASGSVSSANVSLTVSGTVVTGTPLTEVTSYDDGTAIIAGAQGNAYPSFISIQDYTTYKKSDISDWSVIDLIYFDNGNGTTYLYSPREVNTESLVSYVPSTANVTKIYSTSSSYASFSTKESVVSALGTATGTGTSAAASQGGVYLFQLANGTVGVLTITSLDGSGRASQIAFKWAASY